MPAGKVSGTYCERLWRILAERRATFAHLYWYPRGAGSATALGGSGRRAAACGGGMGQDTVTKKNEMGPKGHSYSCICGGACCGRWGVGGGGGGLHAPQPPPQLRLPAGGAWGAFQTSKGGKALIPLQEKKIESADSDGVGPMKFFFFKFFFSWPTHFFPSLFTFFWLSLLPDT